MMGYGLIAYKPNSDDYCKGCHMASYSSDFICEFGLNQEQIVDKLIELIYYKCDTGEEGYEQVLIFFGDEENYRIIFKTDWIRSIHGIEMDSDENPVMLDLVSLMYKKDDRWKR